MKPIKIIMTSCFITIALTSAASASMCETVVKATVHLLINKSFDQAIGNSESVCNGFTVGFAGQYCALLPQALQQSQKEVNGSVITDAVAEITAKKAC